MSGICYTITPCYCLMRVSKFLLHHVSLDIVSCYHGDILYLSILNLVEIDCRNSSLFPSLDDFKLTSKHAPLNLQLSSSQECFSIKEYLQQNLSDPQLQLNNFSCISRYGLPVIAEKGDGRTGSCFLVVV